MSSFKSYTENAILLLPARGCKAAVAGAVWRPAVKPEESLQVKSDLWHFGTGITSRSHTAGRSWAHFPEWDSITIILWQREEKNRGSADEWSARRFLLPSTDPWAHDSSHLKVLEHNLLSIIKNKELRAEVVLGFARMWKICTLRPSGDIIRLHQHFGECWYKHRGVKHSLKTGLQVFGWI